MAESHTLRLKKEVKNYLQETFTARFHCEVTDGIKAKKRKWEGTNETIELKRFKLLLGIMATPPMYTTLRVNPLVYSKEQIKRNVEEKLRQMYMSRTLDPPEVMYHPRIPDLMIMKNRGPMNSLQRHPKEVIVDLMCGMAVLRGADIFAPGVLAAHAGMNISDNVSVFCDLDGQCRKGLMTPFQGRKLFIGNGKALVSRKQLFVGRDIIASGVAVQMTNALYDAPSLSEFLTSDVFPQNLPSAVASHVLEPQPGETILDMCAAPGGKTTHIAALMQNKGRIVAIDRSDDKVGQIKKNAAFWNLTIIDAYKHDSTNLFKKDAVLGLNPPYPGQVFDRILLDGPCSALGQRPCLSNQMKLNEVKSFPVLQRKLFRNAYELLRVGGTIVYSTCTIPMQENECLVQWALDEYPDLQLVEQVPHIGGPGYPGSRLPEDHLGLVQRFDPTINADLELVKSLKADAAQAPAYMGGGAAAAAKFEKTRDGGGSWATEDVDGAPNTNDYQCSCYSSVGLQGTDCPRHKGLYTTFTPQKSEDVKMDVNMDVKCSDIDMGKCETDTIGFFIAKFIKTWWQQ